MKRTTVYLPEELKARLAERARERGCSEAELIREGIELVAVPRPKIPLFETDEPLGTDPDEIDREIGEAVEAEYRRDLGIE